MDKCIRICFLFILKKRIAEKNVCVFINYWCGKCWLRCFEICFPFSLVVQTCGFSIKTLFHIVNLMPDEDPWPKHCVSNKLSADSVHNLFFFYKNYIIKSNEVLVSQFQQLWVMGMDDYIEGFLCKYCSNTDLFLYSRWYAWCSGTHY